MITVNSENKIEINDELLRSKPRLISLIETINKNNINAESLSNEDTNGLIRCMLVLSS